MSEPEKMIIFSWALSFVAIVYACCTNVEMISKSKLMIKISKIDRYLMNEAFITRGNVEGKPFAGDKNQHLRDELVNLRKQLTTLEQKLKK